MTFKIGSVYRQRDGQLVRLESYPAESIPAVAGYARVVRLVDGLTLGPRDVSNGHAFSYDSRHRKPLAGDLMAEHIGVKLEDCKRAPPLDPSAMRDTAAMQARKAIPPAAPAQIKRKLHWTERSLDLSASSHLVAPHLGSAQL